MQIPVLIEPVAGNGFRATGGEPIALMGEGATPEEALGKLKQSLQALAENLEAANLKSKEDLEKLKQALEGRLDAGARIVSVQVPSSDHPWLPFAGMFHEDDPLVQQWREIMAEARQDDDNQQVS